jgi:hypothetical protein
VVRQSIVLNLLFMGKTIEYTDLTLIAGEKQGYSDKNQYC